MMSRFSLAVAGSLKRSSLKFRPVSAISTSAIAFENAGKTSSNDPSNYPPEYPPPTSKRDFVNFPRPILRDTAPPVRLGFIPESWFDSLYPKIGYTGPYVLIGGLLNVIFSKEIIVYNHYGGYLILFVGSLITVHLKFGDKIAVLFNKKLEDINRLDRIQEQEKQDVRDQINYLEGKVIMKSAIEEVTKATTEFVYLQMELNFRERLQEVYKQVKNKLDCQVELELVEKRAAQKNLKEYILSNVMKSITPEMDKNSVLLCIKNLNSLSATF